MRTSLIKVRSWETIQEWDPFVQYFQVEMPLQVVQVENDELLYGTGTGHFAGFFSTSAILRHNVAGATDTTALDAIRPGAGRTRPVHHVAVELVGTKKD
jgi:hypothetical protein